MEQLQQYTTDDLHYHSCLHVQCLIRVLLEAPPHHTTAMHCFILSQILHHETATNLGGETSQRSNASFPKLNPESAAVLVHCVRAHRHAE
jgi:hypothetical protein